VKKGYCFGAVVVAGVPVPEGVVVVVLVPDLVVVPELPDLVVVLAPDLVVVPAPPEGAVVVVVLVPDAPPEPPLRERMVVVVLDLPPERISTPVRDLRRSRTTMSGWLRSMITVRPHPRLQRCP
jgi:hypothetical protein